MTVLEAARSDMKDFNIQNTLAAMVFVIVLAASLPLHDNLLLRQIITEAENMSQHCNSSEVRNLESGIMWICLLAHILTVVSCHFH